MVEIKQISEKEYKVGENRIYLGEDNTIYFIAVGEHNKETALEISEAVVKLTKLVEGKINVLVDLNKAEKPSPEARKIFQEHSQYDGANKTAICGLHPVARVLASFFIGVTQNKKIKFFYKKEEALRWLKEDSNE